MKTVFKSHGLWTLIEIGAGNAAEEQKKDARALCFIQQAVHDTIFEKITAAESAKVAWTTLKTTYQGSDRVKTIKLQGLHREFETLQMKPKESVQAFLCRVTNVVNQIRTFGDDLSEQRVVAKVLRSLTTKFDHVVAAIEESKDLSTYFFDELMGSLQTHETRLSKTEEKTKEKAFYTKGESTKSFSSDQANNSGRGRGIQVEEEGEEGQILVEEVMVLLKEIFNVFTATNLDTTSMNVTRSKEMKSEPISLKK